MADHPSPYINSGVALGQATTAASVVLEAQATTPGAPVTANAFIAALKAFEDTLVGIAVTDIGVQAGPAVGVIAGVVAPTVETAVNSAIVSALAPVAADIKAFFAKFNL